MGTPLRKERPQDELTTADLARAQRPEVETLDSNSARDRRPLLAPDHPPDNLEEAPSNLKKIPVRVESGRDLTTASSDASVRDREWESEDLSASQESQMTSHDPLNKNRPLTAEEPRTSLTSTTPGGLNDAVPGDGTPLIPSGELEDLRGRWREVQTAFVDEPRSAVEQADGLVASAMKRLADVFADERAKLEQQWDRGDNVSTEDLRLALQRYRTFFHRLLSV
jgi:hypothetical protein